MRGGRGFEPKHPELLHSQQTWVAQPIGRKPNGSGFTGTTPNPRTGAGVSGQFSYRRKRPVSSEGCSHGGDAHGCSGSGWLTVIGGRGEGSPRVLRPGADHVERASRIALPEARPRGRRGCRSYAPVRTAAASLFQTGKESGNDQPYT